MRRSSRLLAYLIPYVLFATLLYPFAKDGLSFSSPFVFMALRYSIATCTAFALAGRFRLALNRDTILLSLFTGASTALWISGLELVSPAQSAVLTYTMPLFAIPLSAFILKERTTSLGWAGAVVGFAGVSVYGLALADPRGTLLGALLTVSNAFFWGLYTIFYRKLRSQDPMTTMCTQFLVCALLFWLASPIGFSLTITSEFVFDLACVSLLSGFVTFFLWNAMAGMERVGRLTTLIFAVPAFSILLQAVETGILPSLLSLVGVALMFVGIYISRMKNVDAESWKEDQADGAASRRSHR